MRIDLDTCRDPELLVAEVRRLRAVIASERTLTNEEREAIEWAVSAAEDCQHPADDTLRGLLERLGGACGE